MRLLSRMILAITFFASPAFAQPLADKVPANPIFYFGWRGSDDLGPAYAESHMKAVMDQSNIPAVFSDMVPRAVMRIGRENLEAGMALRTATTVAGTMWHHPSAVFLADIDLSGKDPMPKAAVLCQAGNDTKALLTQLQSLVQQSAKLPVPLRAYQSGDLVVFSVGYGEDQDVVAMASAKPLSREATFTAAMSNVQKDPLLAIYVNFERGISLIDDAIQQKGDEKAKEYWPRIRDASGLAGMKRLIATGAFDGKDWMEAAYLEAPSPRTGLLTILDSAPLEDDLLKLAPMDSDRMLAGTFNIAKFVATIRSGIAQVNPEAGQMAEKVFGAISLYVGRDFQKDVLEPIGEHWLAYSSPTIGGRGLLGLVIVNKLNDPKKAESGILSTQIAAFNTAAGFLAKNNITLRAQNMKAGDLSINYVAVPLISPAWCVNNGNLYLSLFPQNIITAARFSASGGKSILDNPSFNDLRKRLNAPSKVNGIQYNDLTQTVGEGYQGALAVSRLVLGFGDLFGVKSPEPVIPPLDVLLKHVGPSGSVCWVDDSGWHSRAVSSFPCAEMLGGGNAAAISLFTQALALLGIMMPALSRDRAQAEQTMELSNLRQIGLACIMYANDHKGVLPQSLDETIEYVNNPRVFVNPDHAAAAETIKVLPKEQQAAWIKDHTDYEYLGNGQKVTAIRSPSTTPLAYHRTANEGRLAVVYADGHAEIVQAGQLQGMLNR